MLKTSRRAMLAGVAASTTLPRFAIAQPKEKIRIGVPTKTYWPTIVCETALRQKLFEKEGLDCELTIYRGGAEGFEAIAAGAADLILNSSSSVAAGIKKGVNVKCVANGSNGYYGWYLVVKPDSKVMKVEDLAGKKVGITSAGSGSDILALWTVNAKKVQFTRVPLGGGGLVPNLLSGNIDATVLYSPLTYKVMQGKEARPIIDFGAEVPPHSTASWIATDKIIKDRPAPSMAAWPSSMPTRTAMPRSRSSPRSTRSPTRSPRPSSTATSRSCPATVSSPRTGCSSPSTWRR